ncbi:hypothetical protein HYY75_12245 [bacterium]|nr:hypothetical protein [bacterium]
MNSPFFKRGFILVLVITILVILLFLGITLHSFLVQQNYNVHLLAYSEVAHFLAEAGISASIRSIRDSLEKSGIIGGGQNPIFEILIRPGPLQDVSLMSIIKDTWNEDLAGFSREVDKSAAVRVEVWLRGFSQTETDPSKWVDPVAKQGWLSVESTGEYRGMRRTISVRRRIWVGNVLPPVVSKFTLQVKDASKGNEGHFNIIRNDYDGNLTDGPRPFIILNHATPESPHERKSVSDVISDESDSNVFRRRGWIWLGGKKIRLNLTSGPGAFGEIFHFYDVSNPNTFQAIKFRSPQEKLPLAFLSPLSLPWDNHSNPKEVPFQLGHLFLLEGFHDKSARKEQNAMYEAKILSLNEQNTYGAKSSILHLFGDARKGFQSRTKVFGKVQAAFPRFSCVDVLPLDPNSKEMFNSQSPRPFYFLPSLERESFSLSLQIKEFLNRRVGGPILPLGLLFQQFDEYKKFMSCVLEYPYVNSYNSIQEIYSKPALRQFPPPTTILSEDSGSQIELKRGDVLLYKGNVEPPKLQEVVESRVQQEFDSISDFWKKSFNESSHALELNSIARIKNPDKIDFSLPPSGKPYPLKVSGGGMIILDQGNLTLRGVELLSPKEALTVVLVNGDKVFFETPNMNQVNIVAPRAEVVYGSVVDFWGSLAVGSIQADSRTQGGYIRYREANDPTKENYSNFYKTFVADQDTFWYESP